MNVLIVCDNDQDGYCAAHIVRKAMFKEHGKASTSIVVQTYLEEVKLNETGEYPEFNKLYFVDTTPSMTVVQDALNLGVEVTILDHHKTTLAVFDEFKHESFELVYRENMSSAKIAWQHFNGDAKVPFIVQMVDKWDTWNHEDPQVVPFHFGLSALDLSEDKLWKALFKGDPHTTQHVMEMGQTLGSYWISTANELTGPMCWTKEVDGVKYTVLNGLVASTYDVVSHVTTNTTTAVMSFNYDPKATDDKPWRVRFKCLPGQPGVPTENTYFTNEELNEWLPTKEAK